MRRIILHYGFLCLLLASSLHSNTIHVPADSTTIQGGIDGSVAEDTVLVAPGTYYEHDIVFNGKAIVVKSDRGPDATVIDGNHAGSVVTFVKGETRKSVLEGFTITHGTGKYLDYSGYVGGGIYCRSADPTIADNVITDNQANYGGGIMCMYASPELYANEITDNSADSDGGGIYLHSSQPTITGNTIEGNSATDYWGGGILCDYSDATISDNLLTGNSGGSSGGGIYCYYSSPVIVRNTIAENSAVTLNGGGVYCYYSSPLMSDNLITENSAQGFSGGGIHCYFSDPEITGNLIIDNQASWDGGGVHCSGSSPMILNNVIADNEADSFGGGIFCTASSPLLLNNTFTENSAEEGGGIFCQYSSSPVVTNTILWDDDAEEGEEIWVGSSTYPSSLVIGYSDVKHGTESIYLDPGCSLDWGAGMIDADPLFVEPGESDYDLQYGSPCIDSADPSSPNVRWGGWRRDMGAREYDQGFYYDGERIIRKPIHGLRKYIEHRFLARKLMLYEGHL